MAVAVEVGGRRDDAQDRVGSLRQVVDALGHGFRSGSSLSGSSIASSWPLPLDRKTRPINAAPSSTDRPTPAAVAMIMWMEIGRASCRERVVQYESISAVAVALQKNKNSLDKSKYP